METHGCVFCTVATYGMVKHQAISIRSADRFQTEILQL